MNGMPGVITVKKFIFRKDKKHLLNPVDQMVE